MAIPSAVRTPVKDVLGRPVCDLRLSVIDQCNLRCQYCMPGEDYTWLPKQNLLTIDEISRIVDAFMAVGATKVRLTGGEPLIRPDLPEIVRVLAAKLGGSPGLRDLAITTNGVLLEAKAAVLKEAGLQRVSISLDTLRPERFFELSRRRHLERVIAGIRSVPAAGFTDTKLDTVVMRGVNDDEILDLIEFARSVPAEIRFIEYMDVGGATHWSKNKVFPKGEMLSTIGRRYGKVEPLPKYDAAPANRYALPDGTTFGIIASTTEPFCATCDRSRLTADGMWLHCLYALGGTNLRDPLRSGVSDAELVNIITDGWRRRADRGAENRLAQRDRAVFVSIEKLKRDPHLEMHTRGG
ncbi:Cyclic pyranopterin monophosphate synthase 1 [Mycobacterium basiliense]|uniref:GTP 3',8-cyclase n=1 Tax=Mycobacterium basiliense TaxID=2094119 RepID=A0A3S4CS17_9MYCO|nr:GTP 3',8-cyclase MoaA [Mycobacterium basiliense]VDM86563.1 Cyclic pyranopterin monophosphate synthase 1 [Mycobacterium basiliense]